MLHYLPKDDTADDACGAASAVSSLDGSLGHAPAVNDMSKPCMQEVVFQKVFDDSIKMAKLSGTAVTELLKKAPLSQRLDELEQRNQAESDGQPASTERTGPADIADIEDAEEEEKEEAHAAIAAGQIPPRLRTRKARS